RLSEDAGGAALVGGAEGFGRVLDERHAILPAEIDERVEVSGLPVEVHGHECLRRLTLRRLSPQDILDEVRVEIPGRRLTIDEDRHTALIQDRIYAGTER